MSAREEKRSAFNEQMNAWVSRQGLWFQLRHAADGQSLIARMARLCVRLLLLLLVVAFVFWIYLLKRVEGEDFREDVRSAIEKKLKADKCEIGSIRKERELATLSFIKLEGGEESFYEHLDARGIRTSIELTDGLIGAWDGQSLVINRLDIDLKAGGSDDASAANAFQALFVEQGGFKFERFESNVTNLKWGYSAGNQGFIANSHLTATREGDGWRLDFKGGSFGQNWLSHLNIKKMVVICSPQGVTIQEALLTASDGSGLISFDVGVGSGSQPSLNGKLKIESMPLNALLSPSFSEWISGTISGTGTISGSTNSQEGVVFDIDFKLEDGDQMVVRDTIPILSALSVVDLYNSYRKVPFSKGGFHLRTGKDLVSIDQLDLKSGELLHLAGNVEVRPPVIEEIAKALHIEDVEKVRNILEKNWKYQDDELVDTKTGSELSGRSKEIKDDKSDSVTQPADTVEAVLRAAIVNERRIKRYSGAIKLGLRSDAFDKAPKLKAAYPADTGTGRIWIEAPLKGRLQTLTLSQAERLYLLGRARQ